MRINEIYDRPTAEWSPHYAFFTSKGLRPYAHGPNEAGFLDKTETRLSIDDAIAYAGQEGYTASKSPFKANGYTYYTFSKPAGPYTDDHLSFDSAGNQYVRDVSHHVVTDKT